MLGENQLKDTEQLVKTDPAAADQRKALGRIGSTGQSSGMDTHN